MVLVIDDDVIQREILSRILKLAGQANVITAANGNDALACMAVHGASIGLVICDLQMPGMDGMELLRHIGESAHKPAVIISSGTESRILASVELMVKAVGLNVLGSLPKPVNREAMNRLLARYLHTPVTTPLANKIVLCASDVDRAFADGEFDYVICSHVLEHVPDPERFIAEVFRVAPRGYFEYPTIQYEYLYNFDVHLNFVKYSNGILRYMRKSDTNLAEFKPVQAYLLKTLERGHAAHIEAMPEHFIEGFEWNGPFAVRPTMSIADLCDPELDPPQPGDQVDRKSVV